MSEVRCFKHKGKLCDCFKAVEYEPVKGNLLSRQQALEVFYSCRAFSENIAYSPEAMERLAQLYVTVADALVAVEGVAGDNSELIQRLKRAGFGG